MSWHQVTKRLQTRSIVQIGKRILSILTRYGVGQKRFLQSLRKMVQLSKNYHIPITLPITASVLNRYARILKKICDNDVELAIHGYQHVDYTKINKIKTVKHFQNANNIFKRWGIQERGYRFPYLRRDPQLIQMLGKGGFRWDSSNVVLWNVLNSELFEKDKWQGFEKILETYQADDCNNKRSLPELVGNIVEIPVSIPDDDMLIERLQISDKKILGQIFCDMLQKVRERGEILVLQMHPERFIEFDKPMKTVIKTFYNMGDGWAASLGQVAEWWKEKLTFKIKVESISGNQYLINKSGPNNATLMVHGKNVHTNCPTIPWSANLKIIEKPKFTIKSKAKPMIGVPLKFSDTDILFLKEEGYAYEKSDHPEKYNWYLQGDAKLNKEGKERIIQTVSKVEKPLLRFWRWPGTARFCLSITGDIDAVTVWDFWERLYV